MAKKIYATLLDLSKGFDFLSPLKLLQKWSYLGFDENAKLMIHSFQSDRYQLVIVNGCFPSWYQLKRGVEQGTVLGPDLFIL